MEEAPCLSQLNQAVFAVLSQINRIAGGNTLRDCDAEKVEQLSKAVAALAAAAPNIGKLDFRPASVDRAIAASIQ